MKGALDRLVLRTRGTLPTAEPMLSSRWGGGEAGWSEIVTEREAPAPVARAVAAPPEAVAPSMDGSQRGTAEGMPAAEVPRTPARDIERPVTPLGTVPAAEPIAAARRVVTAVEAPVAPPSAVVPPVPPALPVVRQVAASVAGPAPAPAPAVPSPDVPAAQARSAAPARPVADPAIPASERPPRPVDAIPSATSQLPTFAPPPPAQPPRPPDVQITIGRVDVHAPPPPVAAAPATPFRPRVSLADFQRQRRERGR
jgi:hypothetical protein